MLTITVHGARAAGDPRGRSSTARRWFSNCEVTDPSCVQCPVLCGRIASSLTRIRPSVVSNISTARIPVTSSSPAIRSATCCASVASAGSRSGAGATTSWQIPSRWVEATTGYAAACPLGDRATSADSSRRKSTSSSASSPTPRSDAAVSGSAQSPAERTNHTPLPSYPPRVIFRTQGSPNSSIVLHRGHDRVPRARGAELGQPRAHDSLVLRVHERAGTRTARHAGGLQLVQVLGRHVLVVERHDRAAVGDLPQRVEVGVVADHVVGDHLRRGDTLGLGQQPQRHAERDRGLRHHPG